MSQHQFGAILVSLALTNLRPKIWNIFLSVFAYYFIGTVAFSAYVLNFTITMVICYVNLRGTLWRK